MLAHKNWTDSKITILTLAIAGSVGSKQINNKQFFEDVNWIKEQSGWFSTIRNQPYIQYVYAHYMQGDKKVYNRIIQNKKYLDQHKLKHAIYSHLAAPLLLNGQEQKQASAARELYRAGAKKQIFLTSGNDISTLVVLAGRYINSPFEEMSITVRLYYDELRKENFSLGNNLQTMAQFLLWKSPTYVDHLVTYCKAIRLHLEQLGVVIKSSMYPFIAILALKQVKDHELETVVDNFFAIRGNFNLSWQPAHAFYMAVQCFLNTCVIQNEEHQSLNQLLTSYMLCTIGGQTIISQQNLQH